jgi:tetratricopeptide (TPR) repeat protein
MSCTRVFALSSLLIAGSLLAETAPSEKPVAPAEKPAVEAKPATDAEITNPVYLLDLAQVHVNYGASDRADVLVRRVLELDTDERLKNRASQLLAQILERRNDLKGAAEQYELLLKAAATTQERVQFLLALSGVHERNKDTSKAIRFLNQASVAARNSPERQTLQWVQREVVRRTTQILRKDPERLSATIAEAEKALAEDPQDDAAIERLVEIYTQIKPDYAKALPLQETLATIRPQALDVQHSLATLYQQNKQPEKALEIYRKLQTSAPKQQQNDYAFRSAILLTQMGKKDEAVKLIEETYGTMPAKEADAANLATVYEQAGQYENAAKMFRHTAGLSMQPIAKGNLLIRAADSLRRMKDYAAAETQLREIIKSHKDHKVIVDLAKSTLLQAYRDQGKEKELKFDE